MRAMEKLRTYLNSLTTEEQFFFARRAGTTIGYLRRRLSDGQPISLRLAAEIETASAGAVTVDDLREQISTSYLRGRDKASA